MARPPEGIYSWNEITEEFKVAVEGVDGYMHACIVLNT